MRALVLVVALASAGAFADDGEAWPGEQKRFHFGVGYRAVSGVMVQRNQPFLILESQLYAAADLRVGAHHSVRLQIALAAGWPAAASGETNLSFRFGLSPRFSLGVGLFAVLGVPSLRGGLELPLSLRFGGRHVHEVSLFVRASPGVFNNITFLWWDFPRQAFALSIEGGLGYTFFF